LRLELVRLSSPLLQNRNFSRRKFSRPRFAANSNRSLMTVRRWIADEVSGSRAALTGEHADHLVRVLRARIGQEFDIATATTVRRGRVTAVSDGRVEFDLGEEVGFALAAPITLFLAVFKFDRMEWAIEKCTELGVARIVPVIARRSDARLAGAAKKRAERWRRVALQASEQSRRAVPPEISDPVKLREAVSLAGSLRIVLSESEQQDSIKDILAAQIAGNNRASESDTSVALAIGPEGGWTADELQLFHTNGWLSASLGNTILRAETAAIAAAAIVVSALS
jgi:16S rRNA (uracil1498-N3)-methyltransferase